jgi:CheY-like chemotaxis protein
MNCEMSSRTSLGDARRILVIEDSPDTADALGRLFESLGQQVKVAHSGETGLRIALGFSENSFASLINRAPHEHL